MRINTLLNKENNIEGKQTEINTQANRIIYFDILRILASIAVVVIHVSSYNWYNLSPASYEWNILNLYDSLARWAVPVFVMISGALFLNNNKVINIKKNILRLTIAFVFWSLFYAIDSSVISEVLKRKF